MPNKDNKTEEEKECKNCKGHPDGDYGQCGTCNRMITQFPAEDDWKGGGADEVIDRLKADEGKCEACELGDCNINRHYLYSTNRVWKEELKGNAGAYEVKDIEEMHTKIKPLVERMKAKYPIELNLEGLEPALTSDITEIVLEVCKEKQDEVKDTSLERYIEEIADCFEGGNISYHAGQIRTVLTYLTEEVRKATEQKVRGEIVEKIFKKMDEYEYHKDEIHCTCLGALRIFIKTITDK